MYITLNEYCRFANHLFIIGYYLCNEYKNQNDILYINIYDKNVDFLLNCNNIKHEFIEYNNKFPSFNFDNYYQDYNLFNLVLLQKYFKCPNNIKNQIFNQFPNIQNSIVLHVRRGDYLWDCHKDKYISLNVEQYKKLIDKYNLYNENIIVISDDIGWCEKELNFIPNINFSKNDILFDFYCLTFSKFNICSCSSFSLMGSYLNINQNNHIVPYPYYSDEDSTIVPKTYRRFNLNKNININNKKV